MRDRVELAYMGEGERVDRFLAAQIPDVSRSQVQRWIEDGLVTVNGAETKPSRQLAPGDVVRAEPPEEALPRLGPVQMDLQAGRAGGASGGRTPAGHARQRAPGALPADGRYG